MEIFKYIPGIKFREVTASASIYVALGELFALGEFSRWLINIFRPLTRKLWEVLVSYLPLDIVLTIKEKDALTALLLFSPLGSVGIYYLLFSAKRNEKNIVNKGDITVFATFFAWLFFLILLFDVIIMEQFNQHDVYKQIFGIEVLKYLVPIFFSLLAIAGPEIVRRLNELDSFYVFPVVVLTGLACVNFLMNYTNIIGVALFLILIFIIISVRYVPKSYATIMLITVLMTASGIIVDFMKDVISQI